MVYQYAQQTEERPLIDFSFEMICWLVRGVSLAAAAAAAVK